MKRLLALFLATLLFSTACPQIHADNLSPNVQPRYSHFVSLGAGLSPLGNDIYHISGSATTPSNKYSIKLTVSVEQFLGGSWGTIYSWDTTSNLTAFFNADRALLSGTYRVHTHAKAYLNGVLVEEQDAYSAEINN